jgi:hypothetical protein
MNTLKILDVGPQATPVLAPPPATPPRAAPPQAVQPIGDGSTTDAVQQHAQDAQRQADAEAAARAERKRAAQPKPEPKIFDRKVGLVDDTFQVFVDLVSPAAQRFRIFGPPDNQTPLPPLETSDPASAHAAYAGAPVTPPVVKTDA